MKRHTQVILYHLLPAIFWLLAIGGSLVPLLTGGIPSDYLWGFVVTALVLTVIVIIGRIKRHTNSVEECFLMAVLFGIASYWLPSVLFLILPFWIYLIYQNLFSFRSFLATLIGLVLVAIWVVIGHFFDLFTFHFSLAYNLYAWIPTGAILIAWLASTIARQNLRVR